MRTISVAFKELFLILLCLKMMMCLFIAEMYGDQYSFQHWAN